MLFGPAEHVGLDSKVVYFIVTAVVVMALVIGDGGRRRRRGGVVEVTVTVAVATDVMGDLVKDSIQTFAFSLL
jgi:hypothetical protein